MCVSGWDSLSRRTALCHVGLFFRFHLSLGRHPRATRVPELEFLRKKHRQPPERKCQNADDERADGRPFLAPTLWLGVTSLLCVPQRSPLCVVSTLSGVEADYNSMTAASLQKSERPLRSRFCLSCLCAKSSWYGNVLVKKGLTDHPSRDQRRC